MAVGSSDVAEGRFGAARRLPRGHVPPPDDPPLVPGDQVTVIGGRLSGSKAVLEEVETVPTPSGSTVRIARVRRTRAGVSWEFPDLLRRIEG